MFRIFNEFTGRTESFRTTPPASKTRRRLVLMNQTYRGLWGELLVS